MADTTPQTFLHPEFLQKLDHLRLVAKKLSWPSAKGEHITPRRGFSLEFSDHRKYQPGDDLRYVDWNVYQRLERLFLKVFTAEEDMNVYLLLDVSRSMGEGVVPKLEYAKNVAAALGYIGLKNLDRVGCASFSHDIRSHLPLGRGKKQILSLFRFLESLTCTGETHLQACLNSFSLLFPRRGLVLLLSDLFDARGCRAGLEELVKRKYDVLVVQILDEAETRLHALGEVSVVDVESQKERAVFIDSQLGQRFHEEVQRYLAEAESFCHTHGIDYFRTVTTTPFEDLVLLYLRRGATVR
jgi:uncharacterized protein (DUF58 family)